MGESASAGVGEAGWGKKAREKEAVVVRWERVLARMHLRVLLVEADDSTRHIIAALLRKCSYKVAAVSDGLKAWETLKEKGKYIDLVLTEVELPSISGFCLLTMIMEHEFCKNIPVIMMSSHDSASVVFKCMLRGAADFLSKPIRKNELRNLWQHVWRRQSSTGARHAEQDGNHPQRTLDSTSENNTASIHSINDVANVQKFRESAEKGSDTQKVHTKSWKSFLTDNKDDASKGDRDAKSVSSAPLTNGANEDKSRRLIVEMALYNEAIGSIGVEEKSFYKNISCDNNAKMVDPCKESHDLIGRIENQPKFHNQHNGPSFTGGGEDVESPVGAKLDDLCTSTSSPLLELSLRSSPPQGCEKRENEGRNTLYHSHASAFSWYSNNIGKQNILPSSDSSTKLRVSTVNCQLYVPNQLAHDAVGSPQVGFIPIPYHLGGSGFDGFSSGYGALVQPMFYGQPGLPFWTMHSARQQDGVNYSSSIQPGQETHGYEQSKWLHDQTASNIDMPILDQNVNTIKEVISGVSGDNILYDGSKTLLSSNGCETDGSNVNSIIAVAAANGKTEEEHYENNLAGGADLRKSSQRVEALTKFRLKRKDRCFDKKVQYQSRKSLAEQRPRVKGQFVRQVHYDS